MFRRCLTVAAVLAMGLAAPQAQAAHTGETVGLDDEFWGTSIGQIDNAQAPEGEKGIWNGTLDLTAVDGWLASGGVHSFALIPPSPGYLANGDLPLAGVPDVGFQEMTLTFDDWSSATVPLINAAFIKRGITEGAQREYYYDDMNFHDHTSPDVIPVNGGPRPVIYQVDLSAHQGRSLALDAVVDLRGNGWSEANKLFHAYEVTKPYDYTTVTYGSLVFDGDIPELPFDATATQDAYLVNGDDTPYGAEDAHCVTSTGVQDKAMILDFDMAATGAQGMQASGDGYLSVNVLWDRQQLNPPQPASLLTVYEMIGDPWDQATVTAVNYCPDGDVANILGEIAGSKTVALEEIGQNVDPINNPKRTEIPVSAATINKLLSGEIRGLAISSSPGQTVNACIRTLEAVEVLNADPRLIFWASGSAPVPGDANGDGAVTDADYTLWADNYGASGATQAMGDFNGDGEVTDADYTLWADNYGAGTTGVPEPATLALLALGGLAALRRRR